MNVQTSTPPLLPGGYGRSNYVVGDSAPVVSHGEGFELVIEDGHRLVDLNNNFTALLHGHAQPEIVAAATEALGKGSSYGLPNPRELEHAAALVGRIAWAEQVRHTNSGTEAVMTAVRLARATTGRDKVIIQRPAYHGTASTVLPALSDAAKRGVPASVANELIPIPTGDSEALEAALAQSEGRLAAVLIDLMPSRNDLGAVSRDFLRRAREGCDAQDAYLIVDEVISFRLRTGGLTGTYGVQPDLMAVGKLIGGGLPVGAVVGTKESLRLLNPRRPDAIPHGGTFSANPVSMAAGVAALELATEAELGRINELGDRLRDQLKPVAQRLGWKTGGQGSLLNLLPNDRSAESVLRLWWAAYERGVLITPGTGLMCVSTPMDESVIDQAASVLIESLESLGGTASELPATTAPQERKPA